MPRKKTEPESVKGTPALELVDTGVQLPLAEIAHSGQRWRSMTADEGMAELGHSIRAQGLIHAVSVIKADSATKRANRRAKYEVINGHRRTEASLREGLPTIRANVWEYNGDPAERDLAIAQHLHAANLSEPLIPLERGRMFSAVMAETGMSVEQVAEVFDGETVQSIEEALRYLTIDEKVIDLFEAHPGRVTEAHLRMFADYASSKMRGWRMKPDEQLKIARELVDQTDKEMVKDTNKLKTRIRREVKERRDREAAKANAARRRQTDPVKDLFKQLEAAETAIKALTDVDLRAVKQIDPADKGDALNRVYKLVEELTAYADDRLARLKVKRAAA